MNWRIKSWKIAYIWIGLIGYRPVNFVKVWTRENFAENYELKGKMKV